MKPRPNKRSSAKIRVKGVVQGVGFRPFVYKHAVELHLTGYVKNLGAHVDVDVDGSYDAIVRLIAFLKQGPPISRIDDVEVEWHLSLIHISEPTRRTPISYAVFCLKK